MTFSHFNKMYPVFLLSLFVWGLPLTANCSTGEEVSEKRIGLAMRMIGHEVLLCLGDDESRVMPIEQIDEHYKISFEFEFGFDPDDIVSIVDRVMTETRIASHYFIEVEQCKTKKVVHSFEIRNPAYSGMIPCIGRALPKDCYSLLITILDDAKGHLTASSTFKSGPPSDLLFVTSLKSKIANPSKYAFLFVPALILIGFIGYFIRKKYAGETDPNLILIGSFQFDKRNMVLSFGKKRVELSNKEAELLSLLHTSANAPLEREVILQRVWGDEGDYVGRTLDVFISKLRKKLEADTSVKIVNIRGIGYKLVI